MFAAGKSTVALVVLLGLVTGAPLGLIDNEGSPQPIFIPPPDDIRDAAHPSVLEASLAPILVQSGTDQPFKGTGAPGINLRVETSGNVLGWTLKGWANQTTPSSIKTCSSPGVHFDQYNWAFEADGSSSAGRGVFFTTPTTVPQRLSPAGDQCLLRAAATGIWHLHICIEGPPVDDADQAGPPRGLYDAEDGRHLDSWDRCIDQDVQVRA